MPTHQINNSKQTKGKPLMNLIYSDSKLYMYTAQTKREKVRKNLITILYNQHLEPSDSYSQFLWHSEFDRPYVTKHARLSTFKYICWQSLTSNHLEDHQTSLALPYPSSRNEFSRSLWRSPMGELRLQWWLYKRMSRIILNHYMYINDKK